MDLLQVEPQRDQLQQLIIDDVLKHLESESDPVVALRVALLLAINLLQQEDDLIATDFCDTMLSAFPPLSEAFAADNTLPFCGGYKVLRANDENDHCKVALPKEYIAYVAGPFLERSGEQ